MGKAKGNFLDFWQTETKCNETGARGENWDSVMNDAMILFSWGRQAQKEDEGDDDGEKRMRGQRIEKGSGYTS